MSSTIKPATTEPVKPTALSPMNATLLETGKYSDLVIKCDGREWKVHRSIVCLQSKPLAAAIDKAFKESITGEYEIKDDDKEIVDRMIRFMYTTEYCDNPKIATATGAIQKIPGVSEALLINTKVYVMAELYDVAALKDHAALKFSKALPQEGKSDSFSASLKLIYEKTPESDKIIRDIAMKFAGKEYRSLVSEKHFIDLCLEHSEIAVDVMKAVAALSDPPVCPTPGCQSSSYNVRTNAESRRTPNKTLNKRSSVKIPLYYCESCATNFDRL